PHSPSRQHPLRRIWITHRGLPLAGLALLQLAACGNEVRVQLLSVDRSAGDVSSDDGAINDGQGDASPSGPDDSSTSAPPFTPGATATASPSDAPTAPVAVPMTLDAAAPTAGAAPVAAPRPA